MTKPHLLVVDDDAQIRRMFARLLGRDFVVICASGVEAALVTIASQRVDLVLCDLHMDGLSGSDLYAALLETAPELAERLVIMTGGASTPDDPLVRRLGARFASKTDSVALTATLKGIAGSAGIAAAMTTPHVVAA